MDTYTYVLYIGVIRAPLILVCQSSNSMYACARENRRGTILRGREICSHMRIKQETGKLGQSFARLMLGSIALLISVFCTWGILLRLRLLNICSCLIKQGATLPLSMDGRGWKSWALVWF